MLSLITFTGRTGLLRLVPSLCEGSPSASHLSEEETHAYCSVMYRRTFTADMRAETEATEANAERVTAAGIPNVPLYVFVSNGEGLPMENWGEILVAYTEAASTSYWTWATTSTAKRRTSSPPRPGPSCSRSSSERAPYRRRGRRLLHGAAR